MSQAFYYNETRLIAHTEGEDAAKQTAYRLQSKCNSLIRLAESDNYSQCKKIADMSEDLYRYCVNMCNAIDEMQIEMRHLNESVQSTLEDSDAQASALISRFDDMEISLSAM